MFHMSVVGMCRNFHATLIYFGESKDYSNFLIIERHAVGVPSAEGLLRIRVLKKPGLQLTITARQAPNLD